MKSDFKKMYEEQKNKSARERVDIQNTQRNKMIEEQLLDFIKNDVLYLFVTGSAGSRFPDQDNLAFTNAGIVLNSIYNIYIKYPQLKVDNLLEEALIILLNGEHGYVYTALNTIDVQLYNEKNGYSPFKIDNPQVFVALKESIQKNIDYLRSSSAYKGRLYDKNLYGFVEDINVKTEGQKGIRIL